MSCKRNGQLGLLAGQLLIWPLRLREKVALEVNQEPMSSKPNFTWSAEWRPKRLGSGETHLDSFFSLSFRPRRPSHLLALPGVSQWPQICVLLEIIEGFGCSFEFIGAGAFCHYLAQSKPSSNLLKLNGRQVRRSGAN